MNDELKPCPFCGSSDVKVMTAVVNEYRTLWAAICQKCDAWGPTDLGKSGAAEAWNNRAEVAKPEAVA